MRANLADNSYVVGTSHKSKLVDINKFIQQNN